MNEEQCDQLINSLQHTLSFTDANGQLVEKELDILKALLEIVIHQEEIVRKQPVATNLLNGIIRNRICNGAWIIGRPHRRWMLQLVQLVRILLRDSVLIDEFHSIHLYDQFVQFMDWIVRCYLTSSDNTEYATAIRGVLSITQKIGNSTMRLEGLAQFGLHKPVLLLLSAKDMVVLQATLQMLGNLSECSPLARFDICSSTAIDVCLQLVKERDLLTQKLGVSLLRVLCCEETAREQVKIYDGLSTLIGLISIKNLRLKWHVVWTLAILAEDVETAHEMGQAGSISLILTECSTERLPGNGYDDWITMLTGLCAILSQLCKIDSNQLLIVQNNGIYQMCNIIRLTMVNEDLKAVENVRYLQCAVFRVLRLLFSLERNRRFFKQLFPPQFFSYFIDIGHYMYSLSDYEECVNLFRKLNLTDDQMKGAFETVNQNRETLPVIGQYSVLYQLGAGAFGCVYCVKKSTSTSSNEGLHYALKEIYMLQDEAGTNSEKNYEDIISEVRIIKQQLRHPNIVRYRRVFVESQKLYILMDLVDGASLKEHINSVREKQSVFTEDRIWNIVIQIVLALRYLHVEKHIVHRDLKPNNIMLTDYDRIVITDFGLAKEYGDNYLKSTAGTFYYSCPEIVQNQPYADKADIWSFGCCIYEMCNLKAPFHTQNMLLLATLIVEGRYEPIKDIYSDDLAGLIQMCLKTTNSERPDITGVARLIADRLVLYIDEQHRAIKPKRTEAKQTGRGQVAYELEPNGKVSLASSMNSDKSASFSSRTGGGRSRNSFGARMNRPVPLKGPVKATIQKVKSFSAKLNEETLNYAAESIDSTSAKSNKKRSTSASALPQLAVSVTGINAGLKQSGTVQPFALPAIRRIGGGLCSVGRQQKQRGASASSILSISAVNVQPIVDPILELLRIAHCICFIAQQIPLTGDVNNDKRRVIDAYRRQLFGRNSNAQLIKSELRKISDRSSETIVDLTNNSGGILRDLDVSYSESEGKIRLTYDQLNSIIESVLRESDVSHLLGDKVIVKE